MEEAASCWLGRAEEDAPGGLVFTSSGSVYSEDDGGVVDESSPLTSAPRAARLLSAEEKTLSAGGSVVRLAGLYSATRGAHSYWLKQTGTCVGVR